MPYANQAEKHSDEEGGQRWPDRRQSVANRRLWSLFAFLVLLLLIAGANFLNPYAGKATVPASETAALGDPTDSFPATGPYDTVSNTATPPAEPVSAAAAVPSDISTPKPQPISTPDSSTSSEITPTDNPAERVCEAQGKFSTVSIKSVALGRSLPVDIYLPPCYDSKRYAYPTLYLIQGSGYVTGEWNDDGATSVADREMMYGRMPPFIMVMPANDSTSGSASRYMYTSKGKGSWEDFVVNELVPFVDRTYSTVRNREGRAIGGISRGGYWSLAIAFMHPDVFGIVGGHSPAITSYFLVGTKYGFSMLELAESIDVVRTLRIYLDAGNGDVTQLGVYQLASELGVNKIAYTGSIGPGVHDDKYWASRMDSYLSFYSATWPLQPQTR